MALVECVPNVSEGRRRDAIAALAHAVTAPGVSLLDQSSDPSHNRTVFTLAGAPEALQQAIVRLFASAIAHIDLRNHQGVHPRIGAVDVVPFIPLRESTMAECVELARSTAAIVAARFGVPVYLYEQAASQQNRRHLAEIRRGGFEQLAEKIVEPEWQPDFGDAVPHPTAGVSAIGARPILIAYNVNLATDRLEVAKNIARAIRASNGGFPHVRAMGVALQHRGIVQVSMNLTDYHATPMVAVYDAVSRQAASEHVEVLESEIVGLVPGDALPENPVARLKLSAADVDSILERRLQTASSSFS